MDTFFNDEPLVEKLKEHYKRHGNIIIAYDFDDTIAPTYLSKSCDDVVALLKEFRPYAKFICFTSNEDPQKARHYIAENNIPCDAFNDNVDCLQERFKDIRKVYFNVLLDDKAGLGQTYRILKKVLDWLKEKS